jgi:hypothetical protein
MKLRLPMLVYADTARGSFDATTIACVACRHAMASALGALVQANLRHWFYLRQIGLPTLSSTDRRIESVARERLKRTTRR